jgi:Fibrobacter succinogenes major domain (Fib_succ_major).
MKTKLFITILAALFLFVACNDDDEQAVYSITVTAGANGTAAADRAEAFEGETVTLTATPDEGFLFAQWVVESTSVTFLPEAESNPATFTMPASNISIEAEFVKAPYKGILINGVVWSEYNVAEAGAFTSNIEDFGMFYQWNRIDAWPASGDIPEWNATAAESDIWEKANDPCPEGWRVATMEELVSLRDATNVDEEWASINGVGGLKYTDKETGASIFFPAAGRREYSNGARWGEGDFGFYWSASPEANNDWRINAMALMFLNGYVDIGLNLQYYGFTVRCVCEDM